MTQLQADLRDVDATSSGFHQPIEAFCNTMHIGCAIASEDLSIEYANDHFFDFLEISDDQAINLDKLLNILTERGDFEGEQDSKVKTAILRSLGDQLSGVTTEKFTTPLSNPSGQSQILHMSLLTEDKILIIVQSSAQTQNTDPKPDAFADKALEIADSGYWVFNPNTQDFKLSAGVLMDHIKRPVRMDGEIEDLWRLVHPDDIPKGQAAVAAAIKTRRYTEVTLRINLTRSKSIWLRCKLSPEVGPDGLVTQLICVFTDVTQTLRLQNQLKLTAEKAEKALKAKTSFLGRLSHEVRTPMNAVIGISDALIHHHSDPKILPKLELIQSSAEKIVRIVDETLQHTKLDEDKLELNPQNASPAKSVQAVCQLWEHKAAKEEIDLTFEIDKTVPENIFFDDFRYEQCLNNLISNAVKFTHGGRVRVVLTTIEKQGRKQLITVVKDNGIGMSQEQQASVFEAYQQADKTISGRFGGTGLGMNITKRIIELMGGRITLKSELGEGTVFALVLPIKKDAEIPKPEKTDDLVSALLKDSAPKQSNYSHLSILVADDNTTNHMVVSSLLQSVVKDIHVAEDGQEAIDILKTTDIDVVLMDIHMPVMDGIEATLCIRGSTEPWADVPIIALTADPQYQQKRLCKNIGMDGALAKPVKLTEILTEFDAVLGETHQPKMDAA